MQIRLAHGAAILSSIALIAAASAAAPAATARASATSGWRVALTAGPSSDSAITDVVALSASDAWLAGGLTTAGTVSPILRHWNGSAWQAVKMPDGFSDASLVAANSASDVMVAAYTTDNVTPYLLHWNGSAWNESLKLPAYNFPVTLLADGKTGYWAFTSNNDNTFAAWRYTGSAWTKGSFPGFFLDASMAQGVPWTVGMNNAQTDLIVHHLSAGTWVTSLPKIKMPSSLFSVNDPTILANSPDDVWVAADAQGVSYSYPVLAHYNGSVWTQVYAPPHLLTGALSLVPDGKGSIWLIPAPNSPVTAHAYELSGSRWIASALPTSASKWKRDVITSAATVPGSQSVWAAGFEANGFDPTFGTGIVLKYGS